MPDFDVEAFVRELERLGIKLTATPLADGTFMLNRWKLPGASNHVQQIDDLWASTINDHKDRVDLLIAHLARELPKPARRKHR
jgi:hypothetical protein